MNRNFLKMEFLKIEYNRISKVLILLWILVPFIDLFLVVRMSYFEVFFAGMPISEVDYGLVINPAMGSVLSSSGGGHIAVMIFIWLAPLFLLISYSDCFTREKRIGYSNAIYSRCSAKKYVKNKLVFALVFAFVIYFIALLINFVIANIILNGGTFFLGLEENQHINETWKNTGMLYFGIEHPTIIYSICLILCSLVMGVYNVFIVSVSFVIKNRVTLYIVTFIPWLVMFLTPYSIAYIIQPFTEYGWDYLAISLALFLLIFSIAIILIIRRYLKNDKI